MKKAISLLCVMAMLLTALPAMAESSDATEGGFTYLMLEDGTYSIAGCALKGDVVIPDSFRGIPVTNLAAKLFFSVSGVTSVSIPASVKYFGTNPNDNDWDYVFSYCYNLKAIQVAEGNPTFSSQDGVLYSKDKKTLINYPCAKEGKSFSTNAVTNKLCCTSFASSANLRKLVLTNPDTIWMTYTYYNTGLLTVYYQPGGASEERAKQFIENGLCSQANDIFNTYESIANNEDADHETDAIPLDDAHFPDAAFRDYLKQFDLNDSGKLSESERQRVKRIIVNEMGIASLKGIELFPALEQLYCDSNSLTSLDVSHNPALEHLDCDSNSLTSLDVSHNPALEHLDCGSNSLASLDVSHNPALKWLGPDDNNLTSLDVSHNPVLELLSCNHNNLTSLDVSHNPVLVYLNCGSNSLTSLDVSHNPALEHLDCDYNSLANLDVSHNPALEHLDCASNSLTSLDVSHNPALEHLFCESNSLTSLDVSHNPALKQLYCYSNSLTSLDVSHNPALSGLICYSNMRAVTAEGGRFDLSTLPGFDVTKASDWQGGTVSGNTLTVTKSGDVTYTYDCGNGKSAAFTLSVTVPASQRTPGDANGDGEVDLLDAMQVLRYDCGWDVEINLSNADVNGDGDVDLMDAMLILRYDCGWDVQLA